MTTPYLPNQITLGAVTFGATDTNGVLWVAEKLQGWGSPKGTLTVTQKPRSHGGWRSESFLTPRIVVIDGTIGAPTAALLAQARHALNAAVSLTDTTLSISEYGETLTATVTRQDEVLYGDETELWTTFSLQLIATDPRRYGPQVIASTHLPSSTGGLAVPYTVPYTIDAVTVTGQITINNPGNVSSPVLLRVDGPCTGPIITDTASGSYLTFASSYVLASGNWLMIDMDARTVLENGQASRAGYVTSRGWFALEPGLNTLGFNASVYDAGSLLTAYLTPAFL